MTEKEARYKMALEAIAKTKGLTVLECVQIASIALREEEKCPK